jgi:hypothetical protein
LRGGLPGQGEGIPRLELVHDGFTINRPDHPPRHFPINELIKALRRPRPWGRDEPIKRQSPPHHGLDEEKDP